MNATAQRTCPDCGKELSVFAYDRDKSGRCFACQQERRREAVRNGPACVICGRKGDPHYSSDNELNGPDVHFDELPVHRECLSRSLKYFAPYRQLGERKWYHHGWKTLSLYDELACGHHYIAEREKAPRDRYCERCAPDVLRAALAETGGRLWTKYPDARKYKTKQRRALPAIAANAPLPERR